MKIEHVAMYVNDLETARDFFVKYFGGTANDGYYNQKTGFSSFFISFDDGARLEIMNKPQIGEFKRPENWMGFAHIALSVGIVIAHWGSGTIHYGVQSVFTDGFDAGYMTTAPAQNKIALYCMSAQKTLANCYAYNVIASASGNQFTDNTSLSTGNGDNFEVYY